MNIITKKIADELKKVDSRTLTPLEVKNLQCIDVRPNYDSIWVVTTFSGKEIKIVRYDDDNLERVLTMVEQVPFEEILASVCKANIYYD